MRTMRVLEASVGRHTPPVPRACWCWLLWTVVVGFGDVARNTHGAHERRTVESRADDARHGRLTLNPEAVSAPALCLFLVLFTSF